MISVIICTYNREKYIYNVLKSVADNEGRGAKPRVSETYWRGEGHKWGKSD